MADDANEPTSVGSDGVTDDAADAPTDDAADSNGADNVDYDTEIEGSEYTPIHSTEDADKKAAYREYKLLEQNIKCQNDTLENIKEEIQNLKRKPCLTKCEKNELKNLEDSLEREMVKLEELVRRAINLQNLGSRRHYREFRVATTFDEDNLKLSDRTYEALQRQVHRTHEKLGTLRPTGGASSELTSCSCQESQSDEKVMKEIFAALKQCNKKKNKHQYSPCKDKESMEKIKEKVKNMQETICKLNEELSQYQSNQKPVCPPSVPSPDATMLCLGKGEKSKNFQQLKDNYVCLLTEYNKKDEQLKELTRKLKSTCARSAGGVCHGGESGSADQSELILLRNRLNEMKEEQTEFKCLMKEQSHQLDEYRNKYLTAQQKVEEQTALIEKLNMNNKCIEKQINQEIKEIRAKFQERLADLVQFPKLLENEQIKLAEMCKEKEQLETKLIIVCKELKALKAKQQNNANEDCKPLLERCQNELAQAKREAGEYQKQRDMISEQYRATVDDLNTLRSESAKIIARTKERAEVMKQQQQDQIDRLEKELARCRATACLSVSDRESVIREMQGQLNTLSYSFDAAQKQIKTLRNHIAYMSNENNFPAKC